MKRFSFLLILSTIAILSMAQAKYVFYFIGDGMGPNQVLAAEMYQAALESKIGRVPLLVTQFPYSGQAATFSSSWGITDSAASGTCLASGKKTNNGMIGMTPDGENAYSIAHQLKQEDWAVGIMSSVPVDHATPASQYAHAEKRNEYYKIGTHLAESGFDFFAGGGFQSPINKDDFTAPNLYDVCKKAGYTMVGSYDEAMKKIGEKKILLVPQYDLDNPAKGADALPYAIDRKAGDLSLAQLVEVAIAKLSKSDRFYMMAEGGKIDYSGHGNDAATNIHEVMDFDAAIAVAYRFYEQHPDETLIVVTADHETGGMALGNRYGEFELQLLANQKCSSDKLSARLSALHQEQGEALAWEQVKSVLAELTGLYGAVEVNEKEDVALQEAYQNMMSKKESIKTLYEDINALAGKALHMLNDKAGIGWTTGGHTATAVPIFAIGVGAERFTGWHDNSELAPLIYQSTQSK